MKSLHLIVVGKNKDKNYLALEAEYLKRIRTFKLHIHEVKSHQEDLDLEAREVLKKLSSLDSPPYYLLTERGKAYDSLSFSKKCQVEFGDFALIIGGASGHGEELYKGCKGEISLSPLTLPHKMARLVLIEQIYRAETIILGHPYNK